MHSLLALTDVPDGHDGRQILSLLCQNGVFCGQFVRQVKLPDVRKGMPTGQLVRQLKLPSAWKGTVTGQLVRQSRWPNTKNAALDGQTARHSVGPVVTTLIGLAAGHEARQLPSPASITKKRSLCGHCATQMWLKMKPKPGAQCSSHVPSLVRVPVVVRQCGSVWQNRGVVSVATMSAGQLARHSRPTANGACAEQVATQLPPCTKSAGFGQATPVQLVPAGQVATQLPAGVSSGRSRGQLGLHCPSTST